MSGIFSDKLRISLHTIDKKWDLQDNGKYSSSQSRQIVVNFFRRL